MFFFFKQKTAYEMRISDLSSDVCSSDLVLATGVPFLGIVDAELQAKFLRQMDAVMGRIAGIRRFGSAALDLAYVAAGRYDGYWENGLKPWDVAAGLLLVRESGGFVTEIGGRRYELGAPDILAANADLHQPSVEMIGAASRHRSPPVLSGGVPWGLFGQV